MTGKGELVKYYRFHKTKPLSDDDKKELKARIGLIIDNATQTITITALVGAGFADLIKEIEDKKRAFDSTIDAIVARPPKNGEEQ